MEERSGRGREVIVQFDKTPGVPGMGAGPVHHQEGRSPLGPER